MTAAELVGGFRDLVRRLYSEEETERRRATFREKYLRPARENGS